MKARPGPCALSRVPAPPLAQQYTVFCDKAREEEGEGGCYYPVDAYRWSSGCSLNAGLFHLTPFFILHNALPINGNSIWTSLVRVNEGFLLMFFKMREVCKLNGLNKRSSVIITTGEFDFFSCHVCLHKHQTIKCSAHCLGQQREAQRKQRHYESPVSLQRQNFHKDAEREREEIKETKQKNK